jgi:hypothetical protein
MNCSGMNCSFFVRFTVKLPKYHEGFIFSHANAHSSPPRPSSTTPPLQPSLPPKTQRSGQGSVEPRGGRDAEEAQRSTPRVSRMGQGPRPSNLPGRSTSNLPGLNNAESSTSGRFVATNTITLEFPENPSIFVKSLLIVCSLSLFPPPSPAPLCLPWLPTASISLFCLFPQKSTTITEIPLLSSSSPSLLYPLLSSSPPPPTTASTRDAIGNKF